VALLRAVHQVLDGDPKILDDPVALRLLDPAAGDHIRKHAERFAGDGARGLRAHVVLRSRFAEDRLAGAVARGVRQCVVLGAGLDTFAYRQPAWAREMAIFEIDHPASQDEKRRRLAAGGVAIPGNVRHVAVDFELEPLPDALVRGGVDVTAPVFFTWLGVLMYLTEAAGDAVLGTVAALPPGTEIVFTFSQPEGVRRSEGPSLAERAAELGEPWLTRYTPAELEAKLRAFGFTEVELLDPADAAILYFRDRSDGLAPPRRTSIARARV
jgi:methyltransferase (TIGR00027 family)